MKRLATSVLIGVLLFSSVEATACPTLTPAGKAEQAKKEQRYLRTRSDKVVIGIWHLEDEEREPEYRKRGVIEVGDGKRVTKYRVSIPGEINCGFPYYYLSDGDRGRFYLKRSDVQENDDRSDGFIDNFDYVHFEALNKAK